MEAATVAVAVGGVAAADANRRPQLSMPTHNTKLHMMINGEVVAVNS